MSDPTDTATGRYLDEIVDRVWLVYETSDRDQHKTLHGKETRKLLASWHDANGELPLLPEMWEAAVAEIGQSKSDDTVLNRLLAVRDTYSDFMRAALQSQSNPSAVHRLAVTALPTIGTAANAMAEVLPYVAASAGVEWVPLRPADLRTIFDVSQDTLKRRLGDGTIPATKMSSKSYLLNPADLPNNWQDLLAKAKGR
ncbi:MAG: hypothetical protein Q8K78_18200 [Planctomycetaceae bacterium]|nr:hypothetical protein [Planctomycetaceae bacterium]